MWLWVLQIQRLFLFISALHDKLVNEDGASWPSTPGASPFLAFSAEFPLVFTPFVTLLFFLDCFNISFAFVGWRINRRCHARNPRTHLPQGWLKESARSHAKHSVSTTTTTTRLGEGERAIAHETWCQHNHNNHRTEPETARAKSRAGTGRGYLPWSHRERQWPREEHQKEWEQVPERKDREEERKGTGRNRRRANHARRRGRGDRQRHPKTSNGESQQTAPSRRAMVTGCTNTTRGHR